MANEIIKYNVPDEIYVESHVVEADSTPVTSPSISSIYSDYLYKKKSKKERKRRKKRKQKRKHQKQRLKRLRNAYELMPPIPAMKIIPYYQERIFEKTQDVGHNIPSLMRFSSLSSSFFMFGKTITGNLVGKDMKEDGHIAVFGGSGSGKTTGIAIPTLASWKGTIFLFDFKGDLIKFGIKRKRTKILYMLKGQVNNYWYNPYYLLRQEGEENLIQNARELAQAIIPLPHNTSDPFWIEAARDILTGALIYYFRLGEEFVNTIIEIKTTKISDLLKKIATDRMAAVCVNPDLELNPKTLAGVSMELHNHISVFATDVLIHDIFSPSEGNCKEQINWEDLDVCDIFIRMDQSKIDQWGGIIRLMLIQLVRTLERRPEKYEPEGRKMFPTLLMLDEFPQYGKIDVIPSALRILRSKNVTFSLFCQSLADLDETYGKVTRCSILDNCSYKAVLNASDAETQRYFSDLVGTIKVPSRGVTANFDELGYPSGYSVTVNESREPIIYPHEFASLQDIILLHPGPERFCRVEKEMFFRNNPCQNQIEGEQKLWQ